MRPVTVQAGASPASSPVIPLDIYLKPFDVTMQCVVTGVITYSVEWTNDDVFSPTFDPATANWFAAAANVTGATTSQVATLQSVVTGLRVRTTAGNGSVAMRVTQAGMIG